MELQKFVDSVRNSLGESANVRRVFGDPIVVGDKTIIPVARIGYGFGAGGGSGRRKKSGEQTEAGITDEGGGGGGGMGAVPIGVVEVTAERTRFIAFSSRRKLIAGIAIGIAVGKLLSGKRR
jgi:uncharacterized spore protein YtfJ